RLPTLEVKKLLDPTGDPGLFDLLIDGVVRKADATHNGTTSARIVDPGMRTVSEEGGTGTDLDDYDTSYECTIDGAVGPSGSGTSVDISLTYGDNAVCSFTNSNIPSSIHVTKTAYPTSVSVLGETVTFTVQVENTSEVDLVTIDTLADTIYGDITIVHGDVLTTTCALTTPLVLDVGDPAYECTFSAIVSGKPGDIITNTVRASGYDDDWQEVLDEDEATVEVYGALIYLPLVAKDW
nr:hypothetical protein [Anaerolineae bacterium]NIN94923.1 hypothetical protein [Anaerolineae bacterium]NIQ77973.1 hypothetical protein [Anaerolineae bacterium]